MAWRGPIDFPSSTCNLRSFMPLLLKRCILRKSHAPTKKSAMTTASEPTIRKIATPIEGTAVFPAFSCAETRTTVNTRTRRWRIGRFILRGSVREKLASNHLRDFDSKFVFDHHHFAARDEFIVQQNFDWGVGELIELNDGAGIQLQHFPHRELA